MKKTYATLLLAFLTAPLLAQEPLGAPALKLPVEVRGAAGAFVKVKAETAAKKVRWKALDAGLAVADREDVADQRTILVSSCRAGRYRLGAWTVTGDGDVTDIIETVVVIGDAPPDPPKPDAFSQAIRAAFDADASADKARHAKSLGAVWRGAVKDCDDARWTTAGQLLGIVREASAAVVPADALTAVRKRIAEELRATLPTDSDAELTADIRAAAKTLFARVAGALEGLK